MEETQAFRVAGTDEIVAIALEHVDGEDGIFWEDIEQVFPGAIAVVNETLEVEYLQDANGERYLPLRIGYHPGVVLEVILLSSFNNPSGDSSAENSTSTFDNFLADLFLSSSADNITTLSRSFSNIAVTAGPFTTLEPSDPQNATLARINLTYTQSQQSILATTALELARESGITLDPEQISLLFNAEVARALRSSPEFENALFNRLNHLHDQASQSEQIYSELAKLQRQMMDRSTLILSKTEAVLTQNSDLAECPIPRLFIVMPEEPTQYEPLNWLTTVFRLYFICECGEHTKASGSKIPHHLHLANHEGYVIREPIEFFEKYGPFLFLMLELIKQGTTITGHAVPPLASFQTVELGASGQHPVATVIDRIDYSLACIHNQIKEYQATSQTDLDDTDHLIPTTQQELANYLNNIDSINTVDLGNLKSFLEAAEGANLRGILRRMITLDGHFKWVCPNHYRSGCEKAHTEKLHQEVQLAGGKFDEQLGKVEIALRSSNDATRFFNVMCNVKSVLELIVDLKWECDKKDLEALEAIVNIRTIRRILPSNGPPSLKSLHMVLPQNIVKLSNFTPKKPGHIRKVSFEIVVGSYEGYPGKEVRSHTEVLETNDKVTTMYIWDTSIKERGAYPLSVALKTSSALTSLRLTNNLVGEKGTRTLSEALRSNESLEILRLSNNSIGEKGAKALSTALKSNSTITTLILDNNSIGASGTRLLSDALEVNEVLTTLDLQNNSIGERGAKALSVALKVNSTLATLHLGFNAIGEVGARAIFTALKNNTGLTTLNLNDNSIGKKGARALSEALKMNSTLITLNLDGNPLGDKGVQLLSEALEVNEGLGALSLWDSLIGEIGALALAKALEINKTLVSLDLWGNSIGEKGTKALSEALEINKTLVTLVLDKNSIGENGAIALAEVLKTNQTLTTLRMEANSIGDKGAEAISTALLRNSTLTTLHLWDRSIGEVGVGALRAAQLSNATLIDVDWNDSLSVEDEDQLANRSILQCVEPHEE